MTKIIVDVSLDLERRIRSKVQAGDYESLSHFVRISIENQLTVEESDGSVWPNIGNNQPKSSGTNFVRIQSGFTHEAEEQRTKQIYQRGSRHLLSYLTIPTGAQIEIINEPKTEILTGNLLWGQFYKFLPGKVALRVLSSMSNEELPILPKFKEKACDVAQAFGAILSSKDKEFGRKSGEKLATSFPKPTPKSRRRYKNQYIVYVRSSDGRLDGLLPNLKFLNVINESGVYKVGITPAGLDFARLPNPLIDDEGKLNPLSIDEIKFLTKHIIRTLPNEASHMKIMLHLIDEGVSSRNELNSKMADYYYKYQNPDNLWSSAHINTMRAGLLSRMVELGFIDKSRVGLQVNYRLTKSGKQVLQKEFRGVD